MSRPLCKSLWKDMGHAAAPGLFGRRSRRSHLIKARSSFLLPQWCRIKIESNQNNHVFNLRQTLLSQDLFLQQLVKLKKSFLLSFLFTLYSVLFYCIITMLQNAPISLVSVENHSWYEINKLLFWCPICRSICKFLFHSQASLSGLTAVAVAVLFSKCFKW